MAKSIASPVSAQDKQWQKECDARTLAEAEQIKADPSRIKGAAQAAKKMAIDKQNEAKNMAKIAKKGTPKKSGKK